MALIDLTDQLINNTYQRVVQYDNNKLGDGLGNEISTLNITSSYAQTSSYKESIGFKITSEGLNINEGSKGFRHIAYNCNINKYRVIANVEGNIDINIKRNNILLGNISLNNQSSSLDSTLSGWITQLNENDLIEFYISGSSLYINDVTVFLDITNR